MLPAMENPAELFPFFFFSTLAETAASELGPYNMHSFYRTSFFPEFMNAVG